MTKIKITGITILAISLVLLMVPFARAVSEPDMPRVDEILDADKEAKIYEVSGLSAENAFNRLKDIEFITNEAFLSKAAFRAFGNRKSEAIALAISILRLPAIEIAGDQMVSRYKAFYVARKIFEVFPDEAVKALSDLYKDGDARTKGNIIRVSGKIAGGQAAKKLLLEALDDQTFCEEETSETLGPPLRICDVAYNQLVLRYSIPNVLRTIGTSHRLDVRDNHIAILKGLL